MWSIEMNLNPRNWEWPVEMLDDGLEFPIMFSAIFLALGWIPAFLVAALVSLATPSGAVFWTVWAVTYFFVTTTMLWLILLSRYRGVACDAVRYMREYRALPKSDRKEFFPANFEKMLYNYSDMTYDQQRSFNSNADSIFSDIRSRNKTIAARQLDAKREGMNMDDCFSELATRKQYARIEAETYQELM
jgi:hypothetical protein